MSLGADSAAHINPAAGARSLARAALMSVILGAALATVPQTVRAGDLACYNVHDAKSKAGPQSKTALRIVNDTTSPVYIEWIDSERRRIPTLTLDQDKPVQLVDTFNAHAWLAMSPTYECICGHIAAPDSDGNDEWIIDREAGRPELTTSYRDRKLGGWKVKISSRLENSGDTNKRIEKLEEMLSETAKKLPATAVKALRNTTVWFERSDCRFPSGVYHSSVGALEQYRMNKEKLKGVQFSANRLDDSKTQPAMVLHEFAHAFHHRILGYDNPKVIKAYTRACLIDEYQGAYALENRAEFFAELSEAYFWSNDQFPHSKAELETVDPKSAEMIADLWRTIAASADKPDADPHLTCEDVAGKVKQ